MNTIWSPLAMAEWIEIAIGAGIGLVFMSPLAMAEWIEIRNLPSKYVINSVSASDGGVD